MIQSVFLYLFFAALALPAVAGHGQTRPLTRRWQQAYQESIKGVHQRTLHARWLPDDRGFLFERDTGKGKNTQFCESETGKIRPRRKGERAPKIVPKQARKKNDGKPAAKRLSPDGKWRASVKNGRVCIGRAKSKKPPAIIGTPTSKGGYYQGTPVWNAASTHFYVTYIEPGQRRTYTLVESSPEDQVQPKVHTVHYDKPGDKIDRAEPHIFSVDGKTVHKPDRKLTPHAFTISHVGWGNDGKELLYEYVERGFGKHCLIAMRADTGREHVLVNEQSDTYIFVSGVRYRMDLPETREIIWGSERDGWRHLYLLDATSGKVKHRITQGPWVVRGVEKVDAKKRQIIFRASGRNPKEDPYHIHWYRVNFDGSGLLALTRGDGTHRLEFSPTGKYYIDTWSRVDLPPVYELHRTRDGKKIGEIARADAAGLLKQGRRLPERFVCKDRNGRFDIWGCIQLPPHFDPAKKYPVIESIYAGPHGAFVPKAFSPWFGHASELAEEGFIIVRIDGLGTNYRHHDFSHFAYKNLADSGFPDRIKWIREAAKTRPYMDISRVGIYGGSAGGQSALGALLHHGDFYKAAVADCGCHDNRVDKLWWNEQWMDWPVGDWYAEQSNVTNAHKLTGALMLTVGELDRNVDPSSTTQVVSALVKADKDFDYYVVPGGGHGSGEQPYFRRKRCEFFQENLGAPR